MWSGRDPAIIRDPACIAYLIYTAPASKQDPALIWTRLINGHIRYSYVCRASTFIFFFCLGYLLCYSKVVYNFMALSRRIEKKMLFLVYIKAGRYNSYS